MALPSYSLQCPSARGLTLRYSQVGACSKFGGRTAGLLAWRRRCYWGSQRSGVVKVMAMGRKKEAGKGGEKEKPELKFGENDLMELEFGRLLGEPRQATLAKVIGRKVNPEASYIDIEKKPVNKIQSSSSEISEAEFSRLLNQEGRPNARPPMGVNKPIVQKSASQSNEDLPGLVKPPLRRKGAEEDSEKKRPELKFGANDMMEMEFGRLLGEDRQATLAKVIGRKVNPDASYIDIEKKPVKKTKKPSSSTLSEAEFAQLLNQGGRPLAGVNKPQKPASQSDEDLPSLVRPPLRPGQPLPPVPRKAPSSNSAKTTSAAQGRKAVPIVTFGPGGFAAQTNKPAEEDDYMNLVQKPAISSPDSYKPSWPKNDAVPPMLIGKSKKAEEDDYMSLVQKPTIPSPDSIKPSWPKNDVVPPMLMGKAKKSAEPVDDTLLRRPTLEDTIVAAESLVALDSDVESRTNEDLNVPFLTGKPSEAKPSNAAARRKEKQLINLLSASSGPVLDSPSDDTSEERFSELLELAGSTKDDQNMPLEASTSTVASVEILSKPKVTPRLGPKPVVAAKLPPQVDVKKEVARVDGLMSTSSNDFQNAPLSTAAADEESTRLEENAGPISSSDAELAIDSRGDEKPTDSAEADNVQSDPEQSILRLVKKASLIAPVRPPKRFSPAISEPLKGKLGDAVSSADDRLAGWSDEVKAAVKRSEAALSEIGKRAPSDTDFNELLQRRKAELRQRPVPPPTPAVSPDTSEGSMVQRSLSRPPIPSPKPPQPYGATTQEELDQDWARAEALRESRTVEEVVFMGATANGMLANFGSIVGFLAAYELSSRRRPPSFTTWAKDNGLTINRKLKSSVASENDELVSDSEVSEGPGRTSGGDEDYNRLLQVYGEARANLLAALVGETAKVVVVAVERGRKQLRFSEKVAEGEGQELAQKKAQLMTSLNVGDIVKCTVKKVTNFGAFVELQGVPALIHISELSWNRVTDPSTIVNVGQEMEVKVCRLDRYLQRINLSLKQMQPDPLRETLESLDTRLTSDDLNDLRETAINVTDENEKIVMPELIGVTKRLEAYKGIDRVQIGRRIQGAALAPTFQVYLSGQLDDGFKLLARSGNQVQEVLVKTVLDRESMKDAVRQCTFSDE